MITKRRCSFKEDHVGSMKYTYWQCSRRSHPVQRTGGVCAMCLSERLSNIARRAEPGCPPPLTDQASGGCPLAGLAAGSADLQSLVHGGVAPYHISLFKPVNISDHKHCDVSVSWQEMSARESSAGSEQSIAWLIEREIDERRQRHSDVMAGSKEQLGAPESSNDLRACEKEQQLVRSRSYSTNSDFNSVQSTPASCKSNLSLQISRDLFRTRSNSRRPCDCSNMAAEDVEKRSHDAVLTKSKSTGCSYNYANKLRSPIHGWNLPNFWHKKCNHVLERRHVDASSSGHIDHESSMIPVQADDTLPFMKPPHTCSKNEGVENCLNRKMICKGIKWSTPSSFHLITRHTTSSKGSSSTDTTRGRHSSSAACTPEPAFTITQADIVASSSSTSTHAARISDCSSVFHVVESRIAKSGYVFRRWRLPNLNMLQKSVQCRANAIDKYVPELAGLGTISAMNRSSAFDNQHSKLKGHRAADSANGGATHLASSHLQNGEEGADQNACSNGIRQKTCTEIFTAGKGDHEHNYIDAGAADVSVIKHSTIANCCTADSSTTSTEWDPDCLVNSGNSQFSLLRSRVQLTTSQNGHTRMMMQPTMSPSIAALVSMDANLIRLQV